MTIDKHPDMIHTAAPFHDQHGAVAQLHGIGIQQFGNTYYAWGEDKTRGNLFTAIACYSSPDLARWTFCGDALSADRSIPDLCPDQVIERPKVLRAPNGRYVMFLHVDAVDYTAARVGWAVSDSAAGPFEYLRSERPLGNESRDIGVYQEEDGTGYLLSEDRENGLRIYRLSEDYLTIEHVVATILAPTDNSSQTQRYESPALVKHAGLYYLFGSQLTGWEANDNRYTTSTSLAGPWHEWRDFAPPGTATFDSQTSAVVPVRRNGRTAHFYLGDRWNKDDLFHSLPVWLPLRLDGGQVTLEWRDHWSIDTAFEFASEEVS